MIIKIAYIVGNNFYFRQITDPVADKKINSIFRMRYMIAKTSLIRRDDWTF